MSAAVTIHRLSLGDAPALRRLFRGAVATDFAYFPGSYRRQVLRQNDLSRLAVATLRSDRLLFGARAGERLVGYAIGRSNKDSTGKIYWLYVDPEQRSSGVGSGLLGAILAEFERRGSKQVSLVTYQHDDYYRRKGFKLLKNDRVYGVPMKVMVYQWAKA